MEKDPRRRRKKNQVSNRGTRGSDTPSHDPFGQSFRFFCSGETKKEIQEKEVRPGRRGGIDTTPGDQTAIRKNEKLCTRDAERAEKSTKQNIGVQKKKEMNVMA